MLVLEVADISFQLRLTFGIPHNESSCYGYPCPAEQLVRRVMPVQVTHSQSNREQHMLVQFAMDDWN